MRYAQKPELFTPFSAGLDHKKMGDMVMLCTEHRAQSTEHRAQSTEHRAQSTEHRAQSTEHRAQSTEHRAQRTASVCMGAAAMASRQAQWLRGEVCPAACSAAVCLHTTEVSAWWSWCNPGALEGSCAAPPGVGGCRPLWGHANRWAGCQAAVPRLGAWSPSPVVWHASLPGRRWGRGGKPLDYRTGAVWCFWRACQGSPRHWRGEAGGQVTSPCSPEARARSAGALGLGGLAWAQPAQKPS